MLSGPILIILSALIFGSLGLGIGYLIGLFNKQVARDVRIMFHFVRHLKITWKNFRRLPRQLKSLRKIIFRKRKLFWRLFAKTRQVPST